MSLHVKIRLQLAEMLASTQIDEAAQLNNALRLLSKWRSVLIQNTLIQHQGLTVLQGPLAGLDFIEQSAEGCHIAKLLGCYEQPLLPYIQKAIELQYQTIVNIGCAEGYYAVGMARHMPNTQVMAYDLNPNAQHTCQTLADKNGVSERITIGGLFNPEDFASYANTKTLVMCDIEGAEQELLDPSKAPALSTLDIIVESHEGLRAGITQTLINRFKATHDIILIHDNGQRHLNQMPAWFNNLAHLDQLLAVWEWRSGPTPWLVMAAKQ